MSRILAVDEEAAAEAEAQARYYLEHAGARVALQLVAEIEAVYRGLLTERIVGVSHPLVRSRFALKRVLLDRFPFSVVFFVDGDVVNIVALEAHRKRPGYWKTRLKKR